MVNKGRLAKLAVSLGIKGIICVICLSSVAFALVTYTSTVTTNPTVQLTQGATTDTWSIYVNEVNQVRYLPGGFSPSTLDTQDPATYAVKVVTDANKVCAVKVELPTAMDPAKFSRFDITICSSSDGVSWGSETLYAASTGATTKAAVDGLTPGDVGYIHQVISTTKYYEVKVTYSYDLVDNDAQIPMTFKFTPLPQNGF